MNRSKTASMHKVGYGSLDDYLDFSRATGRDPQTDNTIDDYLNANTGVSEEAVDEITSWIGSQRQARRTAKEVLARTRSYRHRISSSWHLDPKLGAYISTVRQKFACSCGAKLTVPSYTNCKCGKVWNAYRVHSATKGDAMYVVREVPLRRHASDRAFEDPDTGFSVAVDNRGGSEVGVVLDPNGSEVDTIHPFNGEYFEDDMYELTNGLDDWLQDADTDSYRRDFHSKKRESRNRRRKARRRVASPKEFGETFLQDGGWTSQDTGRTTWDSPSGNVSYFGHDNLVNVWNRDGDLVDEIPVDPYMDPNDMAKMLNELEQSSSQTSPWYVDDEEIEHPGPDADYMHPYFN